MICRKCLVNFGKQFVFKQLNFIMRKLPKAFSYSGYVSERWIHPLWAIKPIDYLTWLLKPYGPRTLSHWYTCPSPRMYYWRMILWYCSISGRHCSLSKYEEIIHIVNENNFGGQQGFLAAINHSHTSANTHVSETWTQWRTINNFVSNIFFMLQIPFSKIIFFFW